jgi:hypothetical protein
MCSYDKLYLCLFLFIHITGRVFHIALSPRILERISQAATTGGYFSELDRQHAERRLTKQLERLGYQVTLTPTQIV